MNPMAMAQAGYNGGDFGSMGPGTGGFNGQGGSGMGWSNGWNGAGSMGFNPGMNGGMRNGGYYSAASAGGYNHQSHGNHQVPPAQQYQNTQYARQQNFQRASVNVGGFAGGAQQQPRPSTPDKQAQPQTTQPQQYVPGTAGGGDNEDPLDGDDHFSYQLQGIEQAVAAVKNADNGDKQGERIPSVVQDGVTDQVATEVKPLSADAPSNAIAGASEPGATPGSVESAPAVAATAMTPERAQSIPSVGGDVNGPTQQTPPQAIPTVPQPPPQQFYPNRGGFRVNFRGGRGNFGPGFRGGGNFAAGAAPAPSVAAPKPVEVGVPGAPTGPKAMREGLPNRGIIRGRGGFMGRGSFGGAPSWPRRFVFRIYLSYPCFSSIASHIRFL